MKGWHWVFIWSLAFGLVNDSRLLQAESIVYKCLKFDNQGTTINILGDL
jgi:hypothetical protein